MRRVPVHLSSAFLFVLVACGEPIQGTVGSNDDGVIVDPTRGNAIIIVEAPPAMNADMSKLLLDGHPVQKLGSAIGVSAGEHCISYRGLRDCFTVVPDEARLYRLGGYLMHGPSALTVGLQIGTMMDGSGFKLYNSLSASEVLTYEPGKTDWVPPGEISVLFGFSDGLSIQVAAGEMKVIDFSRIDQRRTAYVVPVAERAFPNAFCEAAVQDIQVTISSSFNGSSQQFVLDRPVIVGTRETATMEPAFRLYSRQYRHSVTIPLSAKPGDPSPTFVMGRLDVNDVSIRQPDGSTISVSGTWTADRANEGGIYHPFIPCQLPTKHGYDVPPGSYKITTHYTHEGRQNIVVDYVTLP